MELAPRFCRSCGSRILIKKVCHNCNRNSLIGDNYCYDCGALTPNRNSCLKCGAKYKRNFPTKLLIIVVSLLIVTIAVSWFVTRNHSNISISSEKKTIATTSKIPERTKQELPQILHTILNKPVIVNNPVDTSTLKVINKPVDSATVVKPPMKDATKKIVSNIFSLAEKNAYKITCSYFGKGLRNQVLFFISNGFGYIKLNGKIYELKRKRKGVDEAVFAGDKYEAILTIKGLNGSENEWLASCTLIIKDIIQHRSIKHKVFSTCIEL
jgi:hypothetical protein